MSLAIVIVCDGCGRGRAEGGGAVRKSITVNHRYGNVFLHYIRRTRAGMVSTVARITPECADEIASALQDCASRARKEKPGKRILKLRRATR